MQKAEHKGTVNCQGWPVRQRLTDRQLGAVVQSKQDLLQYLSHLAHRNRLRGLAEYSEVLFSSRPFLMVLSGSKAAVYKYSLLCVHIAWTHRPVIGTNARTETRAVITARRPGWPWPEMHAIGNFQSSAKGKAA